MRSIAHLNIVGFRAALAAIEDKRLQGRPYVIAGNRALALDVSREAIRQNIRPGMALAAAQRLVKDLRIVTPNPPAYQRANALIETVINRYAPAWQNDGIGNIFLDISGTQRLFGPPIDCVYRVQYEVRDSLGIKAAAAAATNKLVSKVASRIIRPEGLIEVCPGNEAAFLSGQDIALLPGIGPGILRTLTLTGFREIGEMAALSEGEARALFGKYGALLRNNALGIDDSPVSGGFGPRRIEKRAELSRDILDEEKIRGIITALSEDGGFEMRKEKLGLRNIRLSMVYSDSVEFEGFEKSKRLLVLDRDILAAAERVYQKTAARRIRIRSICLGFEDLAPLGYEPDLFEFDDAKEKRLQEALDLIKGRFGLGSITRGILHS